MPGGEPTALCRGAGRQRYAPTALCSDSVMPSVMPSQRYALLALCLAGVMPFCARKIYLNTLYLSRFSVNYAQCNSFLLEKLCFYLKSDISQQKKNNKEAASIGLYQTAYCI